MRFLITLACLSLLMAPPAVQAGEKLKSQSQLEAAKAAIEAFTKKSDENKLVAGDLEAAGAFLKRGEEAFAAGRTMFGLGDVTPEAGQDIKFDTDMVDLYLALGQSRLDKAKSADEAILMNGQLAKMKAKVKVFDDRKAELEKLRAALVKFDATVKELGEVKEERARLAEKAGKLELEKKGVDAELVQLKAEIAKRDLAANAAKGTPSAAASVAMAPAVPPAPAPAK